MLEEAHSFLLGPSVTPTFVQAYILRVSNRTIGSPAISRLTTSRQLLPETSISFIFYILFSFSPKSLYSLFLDYRFNFRVRLQG